MFSVIIIIKISWLATFFKRQYVCPDIIIQWKYRMFLELHIATCQRLYTHGSQLSLLCHPKSYTIIDRQRTLLTYAFCEVVHRNIMRMLTIRGVVITATPIVRSEHALRAWCKLLTGTWRLSAIQVVPLRYIRSI